MTLNHQSLYKHLSLSNRSLTPRVINIINTYPTHLQKHFWVILTRAGSGRMNPIMTNSLKSDSDVWLESWELPDAALFNGIRIYLPSGFPKIHYFSKSLGFVRFFFLFFFLSLLCSRYSKDSNIMKYYYNS